jgi:hypothetical protein|tara:strand:- start:193 stop:501 length:309 start_codon:yes stop_codon:yes gene_type:complete
MTTEPKKLGPTLRPMIESILKKSLDNKTLSQDAYDKAIRKLDLADKKKKGGQMKKKKKKKFPDLNNDGKVTMKDILIGRGVIKKAKVGMQMKGTSPLLKKRK